MSRKARKFKAFFRPKLGDLQKKKKKKKKRSSPKLRLLFRPISQIQAFEGGLFSNGGGYFSQKIGLKSTKSMRFCILHKPMARAPPPPWLRYCVYYRLSTVIFFIFIHFFFIFLTSVIFFHFFYQVSFFFIFLTYFYFFQLFEKNVNFNCGIFFKCNCV